MTQEEIYRTLFEALEPVVVNESPAVCQKCQARPVHCPLCKADVKRSWFSIKGTNALFSVNVHAVQFRQQLSTLVSEILKPFIEKELTNGPIDHESSGRGTSGPSSTRNDDDQDVKHSGTTRPGA